MFAQAFLALFYFFTYTSSTQVDVLNSNRKSTRKNAKTGMRKNSKVSILSTSFVSDSHIKRFLDFLQ